MAAKANRALEGAGDVAGPRPARSVRRTSAVETPCQRKRQAAVRALEGQDIDDDHRPVEEDHEQREKRGQRIERPRPGPVMPCCAWSSHFNRSSSLRTSTRRKIAGDHQGHDRQQQDGTGGGGRILQARELDRTAPTPPIALWPPLMTLTTKKSPITCVTTKIEPKRDAASCEAAARSPTRRASGWRRRRARPRCRPGSMRAIELKIGTIMNSVNRWT